MTPEKLSYLLMASAAVSVASLGLGGALLAGLFAAMVLDFGHRLSRARLGLQDRAARWLALTALILIAAAIPWAVVRFARETLATVPAIVIQALPKAAVLAREWGLELPFEDEAGIRDALLRAVAGNTMALLEGWGSLSRQSTRVLVAAAAAALLFMSPRRRLREGTLHAALSRALEARAAGFMEGFERVIGAQVVISLINTAMTAAYLLWLGLPHPGFLIPATFVLGIIPIVGNIMSNVLIIGTALTVSFSHALLSLGFLVFIHTVEHFLNSRIIGASIKMPMGATLLGIMAGEAVLGVPGIVLAPAIVHYVNEEARRAPA